MSYIFIIMERKILILPRLNCCRKDPTFIESYMVLFKKNLLWRKIMLVVQHIWFKNPLHRDQIRIFCGRKEINVINLEKNTITGSLLVIWRILLVMAKKGVFFRKANSFAEQKLDMKKGEPKESGTKIDDVIEFCGSQCTRILIIIKARWVKMTIKKVRRQVLKIMIHLS